MGNAHTCGSPAFVARGHDFEDTKIYVLDTLMNLIVEIALPLLHISDIYVINEGAVAIRSVKEFKSVRIDIQTRSYNFCRHFGCTKLHVLGEQYLIAANDDVIFIHDVLIDKFHAFNEYANSEMLLVIDVDKFVTLHTGHIRIHTYKNDALTSVSRPLEFLNSRIHRHGLFHVRGNLILVCAATQAFVVDVHQSVIITTINITATLSQSELHFWKQDTNFLTVISKNTLEKREICLPITYAAKCGYDVTDEVAIVDKNKTVVLLSLNTNRSRAVNVNRVVKDVVFLNNDNVYVTTQRKVGLEYRSYEEPRNLLDTEARVYSVSKGTYSTRPAYRNVMSLIKNIHRPKLCKLFERVGDAFIDVIFL
jgi:hypothetical protein